MSSDDSRDDTRRPRSGHPLAWLVAACLVVWIGFTVWGLLVGIVHRVVVVLVGVVVLTVAARLAIGSRDEEGS